MKLQRMTAGWLVLACFVFSSNAGVVINELFYHAPNDLDDLQFIELHNASDQPVDLGGWQLTKGIRYQFPPNTKIEAGGYLVLCRNADRFKEFYGVAAQGSFDQTLSHSGGRIELANARGKKVDRVRYKSRSPWPLAPDGYSSSIERISPAADGELAANWAASPLPADELKPAGTPGKQNANYSANLPPMVSAVTFSPANPIAGQPVTVEAEVQDTDGLGEVSVRYRLAGSGFEKDETAVAMKKISGNHFSAAIPGQKENQIIRFRIQAVDLKGSQRFYPGADELRPAFSCFAHTNYALGKIPFGWVINVGEAEFKAAEKHRKTPSRGGDNNEDNQRRWMARMMLTSGLDFAAAWFELSLNQQLGFKELQALRPVFAAKLAARDELVEKTVAAPDLQEKMKELPATMKSFWDQLGDALKSSLNEAQQKQFSQWVKQQMPADNNRPVEWGPERMLKQFVNLEGGFFNLSSSADLTEAQFGNIKSAFQSALKERGELVEAAKAVMQGQGDFEDLQSKVARLDENLVKKLKPGLTSNQERDFTRWRQENNPFMPGRGGSKTAPPPRGRSAFVYVNPKTGEPELFDFVNVTERSAGYKVHFHKDRPLHEMTTINLIFEYNDRFVLAEPLACEVYRRAGNAAELTDFVRLWIDGEPLGYQLLIEQPNRAFLHRNKLKGDGNLYKILWYERGVVGQHEKKTHTRTGHDDIEKLVELLEQNKNKPGEEWAVIKKHFNVEQVINYFAVNMCLSHWDGFFNNYFTYHDASGSGKWEMYPWDQDKTWGFHDGLQEGELFYDMPLTFGMEGDAPPGWPKDRPPPRGIGNGAAWWRPGGYFSKPLLANPQFRKHYLARTKEILETVYTEEIFFPIINEMGERLKEEVRIRAAAIKEDPDQASQRLQRNLASLREHLTKRRKFLLDQEEIRNAGKFARSELK